jgi:hypothetical protein
MAALLYTGRDELELSLVVGTKQTIELLPDPAVVDDGGLLCLSIVYGVVEVRTEPL